MIKLSIILLLILITPLAATCPAKLRFDGKKLTLTEAEWKKRLSPEEYTILRQQGTERPNENEYKENKKTGIYACRACSLALFSSSAKYDSGTGWPSFFEPICQENIILVNDYSFFFKRIEVKCARCDSHLGHVFDDGPPPTHKRYCMNARALRFIPE